MKPLALALTLLLAGCMAPQQQPGAADLSSASSNDEELGASQTKVSPTEISNSTNSGNYSWEGIVVLSLDGGMLGVSDGTHSFYIPREAMVELAITAEQGVGVGTLRLKIMKEGSQILEKEGPSPLVVRERLGDGWYDAWVGSGSKSLQMAQRYLANLTWTRT